MHRVVAAGFSFGFIFDLMTAVNFDFAVGLGAGFGFVKRAAATASCRIVAV